MSKSRGAVRWKLDTYVICVLFDFRHTIAEDSFTAAFDLLVDDLG